MRSIRLEPVAPILLESMRAIGYDPESAVADLVDNSITAGAHNVAIRFPPGSSDYFAIIDDGVGMSESELATAMRHGSRSPHEAREEGDLGRFGLGLKTASMSQCRRLTVASMRGNDLHALCWDLDEVARSGDWTVGVLDEPEIDQLPHVAELRAQQGGTLVVWQKLDRFAAGELGDGRVVGERVNRIREHLALVFHRYLTGEPRRPAVRLTVNLTPVAAKDPFLEKHGSQAGPEERIVVEGHHVTLQAFTLPHISYLTRAQIEAAGGDQGLRREQGFYIYRHRRLITWGTWFRLARQEELTKLTRVRVDLPNALDHLWTLDVKKSTASPPPVIRDRLRSIIPILVKDSRHVQQYRGRSPEVSGVRPMWKRIEDRDGVRYEVDTNHPLVEALTSQLDDSALRDVRTLIRAVASSLPVESLYNDRANDRIGHKATQYQEPEISDWLHHLATSILDAHPPGSYERARVKASLPMLEPFSAHSKLMTSILERIPT